MSTKFGIDLNRPWPVVFLVSEKCLPAVVASETDSKKAYFELDGRKINDTATFLEECFACLPHGSDLSGLHGLDAFSDWVWTELSILRHEHGIQEVAIVWRGGDFIIEADNIQELLDISAVMHDIADKLKDVRLKLYISGIGGNFRVY